MNTLYILMVLSAVLVIAGLVAGLYSARFGLSHLAVFLGVGMLAGVDGPLGVPFDDHRLSFAVGNLALCMILLDGGLRTRWDQFQAGLAPAAVLSTVGVGVTAGVVAAAVHLSLGLPWGPAWLMGAVLASTDAAAVFALLGRRGTHLSTRLRATVEIESGLNDPMAIFLVLTLLALLVPEARAVASSHWAELLVRQVGWGVAIGGAAALLAVLALRRLPLKGHEGLVALMLAAGGLLVFGVAGLLDGSGFLAVYLFGLLLNRHVPQVVAQALGALDGYTWLAQATMFLLLGLLITPHEVLDIAGPALFIAAVLTLAARPLAVVLCLTPFGFNWREQSLVAWAGLRGAVPIVLAIYPVLAGLPQAQRFLDVAFVVVLVSLLLQGPLLGPIMRRLGLTPAVPEAGKALA